MRSTLPPSPQQQPLVSPAEAVRLVFSEAVRPSPEWLKRQVAAGKLRAMRIGQRIAFDLDSLRMDLSRNFKNRTQAP